MVNYREILRLHSLGQSQRTIRSSAHCSDNTVRTVLEVASQKGIQWPLDDNITNADGADALPGQVQECLLVH